jgi:hypothetical protein
MPNLHVFNEINEIIPLNNALKQKELVEIERCPRTNTAYHNQLIKFIIVVNTFCVCPLPI